MEIIDLEMIPGGPKKTCHASQFDNGRVIRFNLKENGQPFALSGTETVQAIIRKPDGSETTLDIANTSSTYVDLITEEDTCDIAGVNHCEMKVTEDGEDLGSGNFDMKVEEDAYGGGDVSVGTASGPIASFETDIKDDMIECVCEINPVQDLHGYDHPWPEGGVNKLEVGGRVSQTTAQVIYTSDDNYIEMNGTKYGGTYADLSSLTVTLPAGTYYLKAFEISGTATNAPSVTAYNGSDLTSNILNNERTLTLSTPTTFRFRFALWTDNAVYTNYKIGIVISTSSGIDKFYPYSNVCPISGFTEMKIIRSGVNVWDGTKQDNVGVNASTGNLYASTGTFTTDFIKCGASLSYYANPTNWKTWVCFYDANKTYVGYTNVTNGVFATSADAVFMRISGYMDEITTASLNYPSTDHAYHPAEIIEKTIQLGQTVYRARINITTGQGIIDQAGIDLGSILWYAGNENGRTNSRERIAKYITSATAMPDILCSKYANITAKQWYQLTAEGVCICGLGYGSDGTIGVYSPTLANKAEDQVKAALTGILLVYPIPEPVSIQLTPEQIETLLGQNNVYHNANGNTAVKFYVRA